MNQSNIPIIAIVGRPNVGKSTLFNRLVGRRVAIEAEEAGTTRDRLTADFSWRGKDYIIADTAGLINPTNEILAESVKAAEIAIEQADLILFLVDFKDELTAADLQIARALRKNKKPVILVVNKCDNKFNSEIKFRFKRAGFENIVLVSAISGKNTGDLIDLISRLTSRPANKNRLDKNCDISLAIVGRPNVGKSTLVNQLINDEGMIVASAPYTTRDSQDFTFSYKGKKLRIADTAGVSKKSKVERDTVESFAYLRSLRAIEESEIVIYLLDAARELTALDLTTLGQAKDLGKSIILAVNKADLWQDEVKDKMAKTIFQLQNKLNFMPYIPLVFISAKEGTHLNALLNQALKVYAERNSAVPEDVLKQIFLQAKNSQAGLYYLKDLKFEKTNPPVFKLSTDKNKKPHFSHLRYLENKIRDTVPFTGTPIFIDWDRD